MMSEAGVSQTRQEHIWLRKWNAWILSWWNRVREGENGSFLISDLLTIPLFIFASLSLSLFFYSQLHHLNQPHQPIQLPVSLKGIPILLVAQWFFFFFLNKLFLISQNNHLVCSCVSFCVFPSVALVWYILLQFLKLLFNNLTLNSPNSSFSSYHSPA